MNRSWSFIGPNKVTLRVYGKDTKRLLTFTLSLWMAPGPQMDLWGDVSVAANDVRSQPMGSTRQWIMYFQTLGNR